MIEDPFVLVWRNSRLLFFEPDLVVRCILPIIVKVLNLLAWFCFDILYKLVKVLSKFAHTTFKKCYLKRSPLFKGMWSPQWIAQDVKGWYMIVFLVFLTCKPIWLLCNRGTIVEQLYASQIGLNSWTLVSCKVCWGFLNLSTNEKILKIFIPLSCCQYLSGILLCCALELVYFLSKYSRWEVTYAFALFEMLYVFLIMIVIKFFHMWTGFKSLKDRRLQTCWHPCLFTHPF